jgi:hypothetical protein
MFVLVDLVDINVVSLWFLASVEVDVGSCRAKVVLFGIVHRVRN